MFDRLDVTEESFLSLEGFTPKPSMHRSQPEVWMRFVNGDETCFRGLFKEYYKEMYGYGVKICNQPELVKDSIQELFKTIWENRNNLSHIESPKVYLFVSLRRKILNHLKKQKKHTGLHEVDENVHFSFGIEEIIITDEIKFQQKAALVKALNQLSDRQKEVIYLFYYNGMSYSEIETILSIKRQSVCNLMYRSLETLRSLMKNHILKKF